MQSPRNFEEMQAQVGDWGQRNFGDQPLAHPLLGIIEELGEVVEDACTGNGEDAAEEIGDVVIYVMHYCHLRGWSFTEIWDGSGPPPVDGKWDLTKCMRFIARHHLKGAQGIRGGLAVHDPALKAVLGYTLFLLDWLLRDGVSVWEVSLERWDTVMRRNWVASPERAHEVATQSYSVQEVLPQPNSPPLVATNPAAVSVCESNQSGVLTGPEITKEVLAGRITIEPWDQGQINPVSYDLRLGDTVAVYSNVGTRNGSYTAGVRVLSDRAKERVSANGGADLVPMEYILDSKDAQRVVEFKMDKNRGWLLKPGIGYLMHTVERVTTGHYVPVLDGKSSIGRLFIAVHVTAGYGDTGFDGQYTLEVVATQPVIVYPGMRFCQMRFHTVRGDVLDYRAKGHYTGEASRGPVPSQAYRQFM